MITRDRQLYKRRIKSNALVSESGVLLQCIEDDIKLLVSVVLLRGGVGGALRASV